MAKGRMADRLHWTELDSTQLTVRVDGLRPLAFHVTCRFIPTRCLASKPLFCLKMYISWNLLASSSGENCIPCYRLKIGKFWDLTPFHFHVDYCFHILDDNSLSPLLIWHKNARTTPRYLVFVLLWYHKTRRQWDKNYLFPYSTYFIYFLTYLIQSF